MCLNKLRDPDPKVDSDQSWDKEEWNVKRDKGGSLRGGDGQIRGAQWGRRESENDSHAEDDVGCCGSAVGY